MALVLSHFRMFHDHIPANVRSALYKVGAVVGGVALVVKVVGYVKQRQERQSHVKDVVYFYTYPGCFVIPNASPFGLKLETWLRMSNVRYENRRGVFYKSSKGQSPFVILNGEEIPDSNVVIERLTRQFHVDLDEDLTGEQKAVSLALQRMIENHTCWSYRYYRYVVKMRQFFTAMNAPLLLSLLFGALGRKEMMKKFHHHGIGRHSQDEIAEMGCEDIRALSVVLGEKPYMMGEKPTKVDAVVFGHLAQIVFFSNLRFPHMDVLREECKNLLDYIDRMKGEFWPDWEQACRAV